MQRKQGISLIVLVITIIVMIILAASVVITLSNTGVINRASQAVDLTNESAVQDLAALVWADAYMDNKRGTELVNEVTTKLGEQGVTTDKWNITVTDTGISVTNKNSSSGAGLGALITSANYGDTVDYSVTVNGTTYNEWLIYYHNSEYVYLVAKNAVNTNVSLSGVSVNSLVQEEKDLYKKFQVGTWDKYTLVDDGNENNTYVAKLISDYREYANTTDYGSNVVGSIGAPTLELFAASWNAKGYEPIISLSTNAEGYLINNEYQVNMELEDVEDDLFTVSSYLASSSPYDSIADLYNCYYYVSSGWLTGTRRMDEGYSNIRPVVCLKASIPATVGTTTDFSLVK